MLHLPQPHPPMFPEAMQDLVDHQIQLVKLLKQWWIEVYGSNAVSGVLCSLCKNQPHPLEYQPRPPDQLQCKGHCVVLNEHTKLIRSGEH